MKHKDITSLIENIAPIDWQESYDNCGYQVGSPQDECSGVLLAMDCCDAIVEEAISGGLNLIITHHPLIFRPLKRLTNASSQERIIIKAIQHNITIYAAHTNIDKSRNGVSFALGQQLGLNELTILATEKDDYRKLIYFTPIDSIERINKSLFAVGAGAFGGYECCSFESEGIGGYMPLCGSKPTKGEVNKYFRGNEIRVELVFPTWNEKAIIKTLIEAHPYELPAYDILKVENNYGNYGLGAVGNLPSEMSTADFLVYLKDKLNLSVIKYCQPKKDSVRRVAVCGGSGSSLIGVAKNAGADAYITGEIGYHPFDSYQNELLLAEIGHFESEIFIIKRLNAIIQEKISNFAVRIAEKGNPVKYI